MPSEIAEDAPVWRLQKPRRLLVGKAAVAQVVGTGAFVAILPLGTADRFGCKTTSRRLVKSARSKHLLPMSPQAFELPIHHPADPRLRHGLGPAFCDLRIEILGWSGSLPELRKPDRRVCP